MHRGRVSKSISPRPSAGPPGSCLRSRTGARQSPGTSRSDPIIGAIRSLVMEVPAALRRRAYEAVDQSLEDARVMSQRAMGFNESTLADRQGQQNVIGGPPGTWPKSLVPLLLRVLPAIRPKIARRPWTSHQIIDMPPSIWLAIHLCSGGTSFSGTGHLATLHIRIHV